MPIVVGRLAAHTPSRYLGFNSLTDFFPNYEMSPNPDCHHSHCRRLQEHYALHPHEKRTNEETKEEAQPVEHEACEWEITVESSGEGNAEPSQPQTVQPSGAGLEDLRKQLASLQKK